MDAEIQLELQKKKLKEHTIRRVIAGDGYQDREQSLGNQNHIEYEGDSRLPANRQSTYAMEELSGRELTSTEKSNITAVFRELLKTSGVTERAEQRKATVFFFRCHGMGTSSYKGREKSEILQASQVCTSGE
eukprot:s4954_g1.t1